MYWKSEGILEDVDKERGSEREEAKMERACRASSFKRWLHTVSQGRNLTRKKREGERGRGMNGLVVDV